MISELWIKRAQFMTIKQLAGSPEITSGFEYFDLGAVTPQKVSIKIRWHEIKSPQNINSSLSQLTEINTLHTGSLTETHSLLRASPH